MKSFAMQFLSNEGNQTQAWTDLQQFTKSIAEMIFGVVTHPVVRLFRNELNASFKLHMRCKIAIAE